MTNGSIQLFFQVLAVILTVAFLSGLLGWVLCQRRSRKNLNRVEEPHAQSTDNEAALQLAQAQERIAELEQQHKDAETRNAELTATQEKLAAAHLHIEKLTSALDQQIRSDEQQPEDQPATDETAELGSALKEIATLQEELKSQQLALTRLETVATSAWDKTVPVLEQEIATLKEERSTLAAELSEAGLRLEEMTIEIESLRSKLNSKEEPFIRQGNES